MTQRLAAAFAKAKSEQRPALISFVIPGYPSATGTDAIFDAMIEGGADIVEVEIPFSDPLADGASIQNVVFEALQNGTTPTDCLDFVRRARSRHPETPIVIMTYLNPVMAYGFDRFATDAAAAGTDAVILTDLPPEEATTAKAAFNAHDIDCVFLVAPTSSDERLRLICDNAGGFIYCVSVTGVTGARQDLPPGLDELLGRVRACTKLPLAVGFGMSRREHIVGLTGVADGVVVGSAFMDVIARSGPQESAKAIREYVEVLSGRR